MWGYVMLECGDVRYKKAKVKSIQHSAIYKSYQQWQTLTVELRAKIEGKSVRYSATDY